MITRNFSSHKTNNKILTYCFARRYKLSRSDAVVPSMKARATFFPAILERIFFCARRPMSRALNALSLMTTQEKKHHFLNFFSKTLFLNFNFHFRWQRGGVNKLFGRTLQMFT